MLSVVVPCFNEEETVNIFYDKITKILPEFCNDYEVIFVDDGSKDTTIEKIKELHKKDNHIKYVSFSRNFGKESAILAGFEKAKGDYIALIDVDLQDPIELLPEMYKAVKFENYDMAGARRTSRDGEPPIRSWCAGRFYWIMQNWLKIDLKNGVRDYHLMKRSVLNSILSLREKTRFSKALFPWIGYKTKFFEFKNIERVAGDTKWSFTQLLLYALDGIFAFSDVPLLFMSFCGVIFFIIAIIIGLCLLITQDISWKVLTSALVMMFLGVQMLCFSVLAQYISKIYNETKNRPHYLIREQSAE